MPKKTSKKVKDTAKSKTQIKAKTVKSAEKPKRRKRKIVVKVAPPVINVIDIDELLRLVNQVQTEDKTASFWLARNESLVVDNILRDAGVEFKKANNKEPDRVFYTISPGVKEIEGSHALDQLEELDDEILEDGQIFD